MAIFLCWSGTRSELVAGALGKALTRLKQPVFLSPGMEKGIFWFDAVRQALQNAEAAIVCLTPENTAAPWIHFEAGAVAAKLSGRSPRPRVFPYLFRMEGKQLSGPLSAFQATEANRSDTLRLVQQLLPQNAHAKFEKQAVGWWESLNAELKKAESRPIEEILPDIEGLFTRKTFNEPLDHCSNQNWLGRYHAARDTYQLLKQKVGEVQEQSEPWLAEVLGQLMEAADGYAMTLEATLLRPERFRFRKNGTLAIDPGALAACEARRKRVKSLLAAIADPKRAPVFHESPAFQSLETFAEKKVAIHRFEARLGNRNRLTKRFERAVDSSWHFDRIAFYLTWEKRLPRVDQALEWLRREIEKTRADGRAASHMPLSYSLGPLKTALEKRPKSEVSEQSSPVSEVLEDAARLGRKRKGSRIPGSVGEVLQVMKRRLQQPGPVLRRQR